MTQHLPPRDLQAALDASERREEELRAVLKSTRAMIDVISEVIYIQDAEGRFLEVNEGAVRMYGYPKSFFIGQTPAVLSAPGRNDSALIASIFGKALQGEPQQFEFWGQRKNGEVFPKEVRLYPGTHLGQKVVLAIAQDISERKRAEQTQQATYRVAEAAIESMGTQELFAKVHAIVRDLMPAENLYIALWDRTADTVSFPYWVDARDPAPEPRTLRRGLTEYVLRTQQPLLLDNAVLARLKASGEVEAIGTGTLDWLGVPLLGDQGVFGALAIQIYDGDRHYTPEERDLLAFVSGQVAMAIERWRAEANHRMMASAIDHTRDLVFGIDVTGRIIFVNEAVCRELGYSREALLNLSLPDVDTLFPADRWPGFMATLREQGTLVVESRHRRKDGSKLPVEISFCHLTHDGQDLAFGYARDITERRAAEQSIRASEEKFSKVFQASPDAININRLDGTYVDVNDAYSGMSGWTREETLGRTTLDLGLWVDVSDRDRMKQMIQAEGHFVGLEAPFRMKDASIRTGLVSGTLIQVDGETCLLTITRDITERKTADAALRTAEQRFRTVLANSPAIIYQLDSAGRFLLSEGLGLADLGLVPGSVVGLNALEFYRDDPQTVTQLQQALRGEASRQITHAGGRLFDNSVTPVFDEQGQLQSVIGIATDVTDRQRAEDALRAERGLFVGGPVMVVRWQDAPPWPVDYISPNVRAILGYAPEELTSGKLLFDALVHPDDIHRVREESAMLRRKGITHFEQQYRIRAASGDYRWFQDFTAANPQGSGSTVVLGYILDITERRQAEEALLQSQKLESLGLLAGGIAHDFNNLLTVVLGNLNLAQMHLPEQAPAHTYLTNMEATVLRATELTKQMLAYSGRGHFLVKPRDLNEVVRAVTHLLEVSISKKIRLRYDLDSDLPAIQADAGQIQQVVMNLITNASDAIGDRVGAIHVSTYRANIDARELQATYRGVNLAPGLKVILEVTDTGCGMSSEVMARIFDPFFTTKSAGRGLGLSAMLGILRGHGAGLHIHSNEGRGSTFRLCFPASDDLPAEATPPRGVEAFRLLQGRILLVDDEDLILQTIGSALQALGLEVTTARDGMEAVARFQEAAPRPDLVLMDLTMPRMDGREAFKAMHRLDPSIPVVLSSGFTEQDSLHTLSGLEPAGFMQKPYQIKELRRMLQRVLRT